MQHHGFPSLASFYADDDRRTVSNEHDFGTWWRRNGTRYRLSWVEDTEELIAVQISLPNDTAPGLFAYGGNPGTVYLLARVDRDALDRVLDGWEKICGAPDSLLWVRRQLVDAGLDL